MKINVKNKDNSLGELDQTIDVKFSFAHYDPVEDIATRLHEWVKCRDFLGDVVIANYLDYSMYIYDFDANKERIPLDKEKGYLLLSFPDTATKKTFIKNSLVILPDIHIIGRTKNTLLIIFDTYHQTAVWRISLFTYLIKCCCYVYDNPDNFIDELISKYPNSVEASYIASNPKKFKSILEFFYDFLLINDEVTGYTVQLSTHLLHNNCGFKTVLMNSHLNAKTNTVSKWIEEFCK